MRLLTGVSGEKYEIGVFKSKRNTTIRTIQYNSFEVELIITTKDERRLLKSNLLLFVVDV